MMTEVNLLLSYNVARYTLQINSFLDMYTSMLYADILLLIKFFVFFFFKQKTAYEIPSTSRGLGLPIVQAIAESYGGTATAWSSGRKEGSTFEGRFPL